LDVFNRNITNVLDVISKQVDVIERCYGVGGYRSINSAGPTQG